MPEPEHPVRHEDGDARGGPDEAVPRPTEEVHLPGPSYLPVVVAFGITLALVGVVMSFVLMAIGLIVAGVAVVRWVGETREDMAELPLEH